MKKYPTINGYEIILLESLIEWETDKKFYKIQWPDGKVNVIQEEAFQGLVIPQNSLIQEAVKLTSEEKFALFFQYFRGREDVYAVKWKNKQGKTGFSPHAQGQWIKEIVGNELRNKFEVSAYYPYTIQTVENHIRGTMKDFQLGTGIYPMLPDDTTYLVVIDFDNEQAFEAVRPLILVCEQNNILPLIELSQSGQGLHIWVFFEQSVPASLARKFANLVLRHAMTEGSQIDFSSFDRIIPMQNTLPTKGFGNIIALPLKLQKVLEGKNIFLTNQLQAVANMWQHLATIPRYTPAALTDFILILEAALPVHLYTQAAERPEQAIQPIDDLRIVSKGELIINKNELTREEIIQLAHLATFNNPEFYKRQQMRMPTWDIPQYITAASEDGDLLFLPRGLTSLIRQTAKKVTIKAMQSVGREIDVTFNGQLRSEQEKAFQALRSHDMGIVSARTGFGKTVLAAKVIAERKLSTLIIVHNRVLASQWEQRLGDFLTINTEAVVEYTKTGKLRNKSKIGRLGGGKKNLSEVIDIVLFQSLANRDDLDSFFSKYGMIIVDEAHHIAAQSFEEVIKLANVKYLYGLTATPERKDGLTPLLFMRLGNIIYENHNESEESLLIPQHFYPRFTSYGEFNSDTIFHEHLHHMMTNSDRNQLIISDIVANYREDKTCLVLTERIEHVDILYDLLMVELKQARIYKLKSQQSKKLTKTMIDEMTLETSPFIVVATGKFIGEGFDLSQLESIFFSLPFSWKGNTKQYLGRLQRDVENKQELRIYDYIDAGVGMFTKMYYKRQREYVKLGYQLAEDSQTRKFQTRLYDGKSYLKSLLDDSRQANEIFLAVAYFSQALVKRLETISLEGKHLTVVCKHPEKENGLVNQRMKAYIDQLTKFNISFIFSAKTPQPFVILDQRMIWYGDMSFYLANDESKTSIRFNNSRLASKLIKQFIS